jgi:hypothetical protein
MKTSSRPLQPHFVALIRIIIQQRRRWHWHDWLKFSGRQLTIIAGRRRRHWHDWLKLSGRQPTIIAGRNIISVLSKRLEITAEEKKKRILYNVPKCFEACHDEDRWDKAHHEMPSGIVRHCFHDSAKTQQNMNTIINRTKDKHFINSQIHDHLFCAHHGVEYA